MDFKKMINDAKAKADANGDGKLTKDDFDDLAQKHGVDASHFDGLKAKSDANGDGKVDVEDAKSAFGNIGGVANDLKNKVFGGQ